MKISVTQEHIDNADFSTSGECAVALAFKDNGYPDVLVGYSTLNLFGDYSDIRILPEGVTEFIRGEGKSGPISFEVPA